MEIVIMFLVFALAGTLIGMFYVKVTKPKMVGYLRVDRSDPDERPYLFLELNEDVGFLMSHKEVVLKVKIKDYIPRK